MPEHASALVVKASLAVTMAKDACLRAPTTPVRVLRITEAEAKAGRSFEMRWYSGRHDITEP